jgi:hypothetical protein
MKSTASFTAAALVTMAFALVLAACGGSTGVTTTFSPTPSPSGPSVPHDTSSPATALIGHWKDANAMDQYFDGSVWSTKTAGGEQWKYGYEVKAQDAAGRQVILKTFAIRADGSTNTDVEVITFVFLDKSMTQIQWGVGGVTADYVDGHVRP